MWKSLFVSDDIVKAIHEELHFSDPTPIQHQVLPLAIRDYADILGSAPTGSGKTLAFGIPLLMRVQEAKIKLSASNSELSSQREQVQKVSTTKVDVKRKFPNKVFSELCLIEELDPDTMSVINRHDVSQYHEAKSKHNKLPNDYSNIKLDSGVFGLVILPTRELALQVKEHLRSLAKFMQPPVEIQAIVGGISIQKQTRLLQRKPEIIIATPGRLWEFLKQEHPHIMTIDRLRVLVFDEADRLIESQHFPELKSILTCIHRRPTNSFKTETNDNCEEENSSNKKRRKYENAKVDAKNDELRNAVYNRQTFVFSATLTFVHRNALLPGARAKIGKKRIDSKKMNKSSKLEVFRDMLGLSKKVKVVDVSSQKENNCPFSLHQMQTSESQARNSLHGPVGLSEFRLSCPKQSDKDVYILWFLLVGRQKWCTEQGLGRCLIFLNSKSGVRRLFGVLRQCSKTGALDSQINILHADMVQKQRLRSIERFQACESGIILATDVAARGLDFIKQTKDLSKEDKGVSWVVHFNVPRTAEMYIHRCGRTARALRTGVSLLFIEPSESIQWQKVYGSLGKPDKDIPSFQPYPSLEEIGDCKKIVDLMRQLDENEHSASKKAADRDWFKRSAAAADIILDSDLNASSSDSDCIFERRSKRSNSKKSQESLRLQLKNLLDQFEYKQKKTMTKPSESVQSLTLIKN